MDPQAALDAPRFQVTAGNQADLSKGVVVTVEDGVADSTVQDLIARGHNIKVTTAPHPSTVARCLHGEACGTAVSMDIQAVAHTGGRIHPSLPAVSLVGGVRSSEAIIRARANHTGTP